MDKTGYTPVNCSFYDILEAKATEGNPVELEIREGKDMVRCLQDRVIDLKTRNGEEFMILQSGRSFRLDKILSIDGISITNPLFVSMDTKC